MTVKRCKCGRAHDHASWGLLEYVGLMEDENGVPSLILRNCPCGSTLALVLEDLLCGLAIAPTVLPPPPLG